MNIYEEINRRLIDLDMSSKEDFKTKIEELILDCTDKGYTFSSFFTKQGELEFEFHFVQSVDNIGVAVVRKEFGNDIKENRALVVNRKLTRQAKEYCQNALVLVIDRESIADMLMFQISNNINQEDNQTEQIIRKDKQKYPLILFNIIFIIIMLACAAGGIYCFLDAQEKTQTYRDFSIEEIDPQYAWDEKHENKYETYSVTNNSDKDFTDCRLRVNLESYYGFDSWGYFYSDTFSIAAGETKTINTPTFGEMEEESKCTTHVTKIVKPKIVIGEEK